MGLGCETGKLTWFNPKEEWKISFADKKKSFNVCLDSARAGASVYRVEGSARTLLSSNSEPGGIGCWESDCKHVTLLLQASTSGDVLEYNYTTSVTNVCPKCTSDCKRKCFCNSQHVFIAEVLKSRSIHNQKYYQNYIKIRYFLRHHGNFTAQFGKRPPSCDVSSAHAQTVIDQKKLIPQYGKMKVKSKCGLQAGKTYLFSASSHHKQNSSLEPSLTMCCAQEDYKHAWESYLYLVNNRRCC